MPNLGRPRQYGGVDNILGTLSIHFSRDININIKTEPSSTVKNKVSMTIGSKVMLTFVEKK